MRARPFVAVVLVAAQSAVAGCGLSQGARGQAADAGGEVQLESGTPGDDGGLAAACDDFFGALVACSLVPAGLVAHAGPRFRQFCLNQANLPGSTTTVDALETCARAYKGDCASLCGLPNVGTLPGGAPCNAGFDLQCQSGACEQMPDAGHSACGKCAATILAGQPCSLTRSTGNCAPGSSCAASGTCVAYGAAGAACSSSQLCDADSFCSSTSHTCVAKAAVGAACASDMECAHARPCVNGACALPAAGGASCTPSGYASPCGHGLTCDTATHRCVAPSVQPGGACGPGLVCLTGSCLPAGTCPTIVPDGQPCPSGSAQVCDVEASCDFTGICAIPRIPCLSLSGPPTPGVSRWRPAALRRWRGAKAPRTPTSLWPPSLSRRRVAGSPGAAPRMRRGCR